MNWSFFSLLSYVLSFQDLKKYIFYLSSLVVFNRWLGPINLVCHFSEIGSPRTLSFSLRRVFLLWNRYLYSGVWWSNYSVYEFSDNPLLYFYQSHISLLCSGISKFWWSLKFYLFKNILFFIDCRRQFYSHHFLSYHSLICLMPWR